ncbi:MAG: formamidopyrimidine-DNA glycosylase [Pirellulaceae bacterium]|nr:MAG: formamidopyrimidine-DNA glycosylase [Pirellulaceae bacterium]
MPELPEVETMCRGLRPSIGLTVAAIRQPPCRCKPIQITPSMATIRRRLVGKELVDVRRLGKRILLDFGEDLLILQPKMTGMVSLDTAPDSAYVRLSIQLNNGPPHSIVFWDRRGLATVIMLAKNQLTPVLIDGRLGPDALEIAEAQFVERLRRTRRPIKVALMDQALVAGIGNLYASEILHVAKIHPAVSANRLTGRQCQRLFQSMRTILHEAIRYEGSTLADGTYRNALNNPGSYQNHHRVYQREGKRCRQCHRGTIRRIVQSGRSTFFCPACQRPPRKKPARVSVS